MSKKVVFLLIAMVLFLGVGCDQVYQEILKRLPSSADWMELADFEIKEGESYKPMKTYLKNYSALKFNETVKERFTIRVSNIKGEVSPLLVATCESDYWSICEQGGTLEEYHITLCNNPTLIGSYLGEVVVTLGENLSCSFGVLAKQTDFFPLSEKALWDQTLKLDCGTSFGEKDANLEASGYSEQWNSNTILSSQAQIHPQFLSLPLEQSASLFYDFKRPYENGYFVFTLCSTSESVLPLEVVVQNASGKKKGFPIEVSTQWNQYGVLITPFEMRLFKNHQPVAESEAVLLEALPEGLFPFALLGIEVSGEASNDGFLLVEKFASYKVDFGVYEKTPKAQLQFSEIAPSADGIYDCIFASEFKSGSVDFTCNQTIELYNGFYNPKNNWKGNFLLDTISGYSGFDYMELRLRSTVGPNMWFVFENESSQASSPLVLFKAGNWVCSGAWSGGVATDFAFNKEFKTIGFLFDRTTNKIHYFLNGEAKNFQSMNPSHYPVATHKRPSLQVGGDGDPGVDTILVDYVAFYKKR